MQMWLGFQVSLPRKRAMKILDLGHMVCSISSNNVQRLVASGAHYKASPQCWATTPLPRLCNV